MTQFVSAISLLVPDYDSAIDFYVRMLGFDLLEDTPQSEDKRWVVIAPPGSTETRILLAKATSADQLRCIGNQAGGRVFLFLSTDDFDRDFEAMKTRGVDFLESPRLEPYGKVVVFTDPFGNKWDLIEPKA